MDPIPKDAQRALEHLIEEDLRGATITSFTANVDEHGLITVEEIIFRRQDKKEVSIGLKEVSIGLAGMRPDGTRTEPAIVMDIYDSLGGWREMTIPEDYVEDLKELTAEPWRPDPPPAWDRE